MKIKQISYLCNSIFSKLAILLLFPYQFARETSAIFRNLFANFQRIMMGPLIQPPICTNIPNGSFDMQFI